MASQIVLKNWVQNDGIINFSFRQDILENLIRSDFLNMPVLKKFWGKTILVIDFLQ